MRCDAETHTRFLDPETEALAQRRSPRLSEPMAPTDDAARCMNPALWSERCCSAFHVVRVVLQRGSIVRVAFHGVLGDANDV